MPDDPRIYRRVYADLAARIADGRLPSGAILNIGLIAEEHETSRPTVAHALRLLEADGKVVRYPGVGWQVQ